MFKIIIYDDSSICLYGNDGGDYIDNLFTMCFDDDDFFSKATIHHNIKYL